MNISINITEEETNTIEEIMHIALMDSLSPTLRIAAISEVLSATRTFERSEKPQDSSPQNATTPYLRSVLQKILQECRAVRLTTPLEERILNHCKDGLKDTAPRSCKQVITSSPEAESSLNDFFKSKQAQG